MKIQTKIPLLLFSVLIGFIGLTWALHTVSAYLHNEQSRMLRNERVKSTNILLQPDYGMLESMVVNHAFSTEGLTTVLQQNQIDKFILYYADKLVYSLNIKLEDMPTPDPVRQTYYERDAKGLVQYYTKSFTNPKVTVIIGKSVDGEFIRRLESITATKLELVHAESTFSIPLKGLNGSVMAWLDVNNRTEDEIIYALYQFNYLSSVAFSGIISIFILTLLTSRVAKPLGLIIKSYKTGSTAPITGLLEQKDELGVLAQLVKQHLEHQETLAKEVNDKNKANARLKEETQYRIELSQDLHDSIIQSLFAQVLHLETLLIKNALSDIQRLSVNKTCEQLRLIMSELRMFIAGYTPEQLSTLKEDLERLIKQYTLPVQINFSGSEENLSLQQHQQLIFIAKEAISNAIKHSKAGNISITVSLTSDSCTLCIADDGIGFNATHDHTGLGLRNIRSRVARLDGKLTIESTLNSGTKIQVFLPF